MCSAIFCGTSFTQAELRVIQLYRLGMYYLDCPEKREKMLNTVLHHDVPYRQFTYLSEKLECWFTFHVFMPVLEFPCSERFLQGGLSKITYRSEEILPNISFEKTSPKNRSSIFLVLSVLSFSRGFSMFLHRYPSSIQGLSKFLNLDSIYSCGFPKSTWGSCLLQFELASQFEFRSANPFTMHISRDWWFRTCLQSGATRYRSKYSRLG